MTLRKIFIPIVATIAVMLGFTACNSSDEPTAGSTIYTNIVTLVERSSTGTVMSYQTGQYTPVITLTASQQVDTSIVMPGKRFLIAYQLAPGTVADQSGFVTLLAAQKILNDTIQFKPINSIPNWDNTISRVQQAFISGNFLNLGATVPMSTPIVDAVIIADEATLATETAELYVYFAPVNTIDSYTVARYSTYDLKPMMNKYPRVRKFNLHCPGDGRTFEFSLTPNVGPIPTNN